MNQPFQNSRSALALLPDAWELLETFEETCTISCIDFRMAGFSARRVRDQVVVTGSACSWDDDPADRAWFELLERISLVNARSLPADSRWCLRNLNSFTAHGLASSRELFAESPEPHAWVPAKSNGVAMGPTWQAAGQHALCEMIERHLVLASWYGATQPRSLPSPLPTKLLPLAQDFRLEHFAMGHFTCQQTLIHAMATFLWPLDASKPVIYGFGAHHAPHTAVERSLKEALQRLCFLHDAEPVGELAFRPTPDFHQDYFLQPDQQASIKRWLAGEHFQQRYAERIAFSGPAYWLDLTPHDLFPGKVVQVLVPGCLPLHFGRYHPPQFPDLHPDRFIHPIM